MRLIGRGRDIYNDAENRIILLDEATIDVLMQPDRTICSIVTEPPRAEANKLVGERAGKRLRQAVRESMAADWQADNLISMLLDDLAGASLISPVAWMPWKPEEYERRERSGEMDKRRSRMENVCIGLSTGSSGLKNLPNFAKTGDLRNPDDPEGWHDWPRTGQVSLRRARRIDVRRDDMVRIDSMFQDSVKAPDGGRAAVHEYGLTGAADEKLALRRLEAEPRVLPYSECPAAIRNVDRMIGTPLAEMREQVLNTLPGTLGCTHLNDAMRALASVPGLAGALARQSVEL